jgi:hypothetical protein
MSTPTRPQHLASRAGDARWAEQAAREMAELDTRYNQAAKK